ncbi:hypothetical protein CHU00_16625 [Sphingobacterium cellulitidis]|uniref:hypothetical protein n=1 Tax=Sphingobacterium cellulitidis TaxID=1768011 RepID=UPI000B9417EB|nr:hypothetical protein [Sphingobacterium cellulitidis]OYD42938.1 hypothetical protein CHT99_03665 [Sphingobacterium cellulitidis]OYD44478.1 hypothetical protein CHU00_16625 [Sphingobacterium cellulitidis]
MKAIITFVLFFFFLMIRSGNSHEVINYSDRPTISFMEHQMGLLEKQSHPTQKLVLTQTNASGLVGHAEQILLEQESEDFQLWKDYQLQMAFFSCLIAFTFLLFFPNRSQNKTPDFIIDNNPNPIFISLRTLRI